MNDNQTQRDLKGKGKLKKPTVMAEQAGHDDQSDAGSGRDAAQKEATKGRGRPVSSAVSQKAQAIQGG